MAGSGGHCTLDIFEERAQAFHLGSPGLLVVSVSSRPILLLAYSDGTSIVTC